MQRGEDALQRAERLRLEHGGGANTLELARTAFFRTENPFKSIVDIVLSRILEDIRQCGTAIVAEVGGLTIGIEGRQDVPLTLSSCGGSSFHG